MKGNVNLDSGLFRCVKVGSSIVTNVPLWWEMLTIGEAVGVGGKRRKHISVPSPQFYCTPKTALNSLNNFLKSKE